MFPSHLSTTTLFSLLPHASVPCSSCLTTWNSSLNKNRPIAASTHRPTQLATHKATAKKGLLRVTYAAGSGLVHALFPLTVMPYSCHWMTIANGWPMVSCSEMPSQKPLDRVLVLKAWLCQALRSHSFWTVSAGPCSCTWKSWRRWLSFLSPLPPNMAAQRRPLGKRRGLTLNGWQEDCVIGHMNMEAARHLP